MRPPKRHMLQGALTEPARAVVWVPMQRMPNKLAQHLPCRLRPLHALIVILQQHGGRSLHPLAWLRVNTAGVIASPVWLMGMHFAQMDRKHHEVRLSGAATRRAARAGRVAQSDTPQT